jgi:predicted membrane protein
VAFLAVSLKKIKHMESQNTPSFQDSREDRRQRKNDLRQGKSPLGGVVLVIIGVALMARQMDLGLPYWVFSWPMIPIAIGIYVGAKHNFRFGGWIVPILIGLAFLMEDVFFGYDARHYFWPTAIIVIGLFMIIRPRRRGWEKEFVTGAADTTSGDFIDSAIVFGGAKKNIITKNFQGGRIENIFGGTDLNMMQADFKGTVIMDFSVIFGGVKLVVPPQWTIRNEVTAILGGIDDKRPMVPDSDPNKVLVLRGTVTFGGLDIKSY